jgi:predicted glycogen debranching enzyme
VAPARHALQPVAQQCRIHVDPADSLLYAGEPGVQLTWMDAKVGHWVVTPRIGKVVEVNALWYNTLCSMADFARRLGEPADRYETLAEQAGAGFARLCRNSGAFGTKRWAIATT